MCRRGSGLPKMSLTSEPGLLMTEKTHVQLGTVVLSSRHHGTAHILHWERHGSGGHYALRYPYIRMINDYDRSSEARLKCFEWLSAWKRETP
jgi:hypothetical protein